MSNEETKFYQPTVYNSDALRFHDAFANVLTKHMVAWVDGRSNGKPFVFCGHMELLNKLVEAGVIAMCHCLSDRAERDAKEAR